MPFDPTKRPTDYEFDRFLAYMEKVWDDALRDKEEADSYYFQTNDIWKDFKARNPDVDVSNRPNFHSGLFTAKIDQAVNAHLAFEPRLHRAPTGQSKEAKIASGRLEKGTQAILNDCFTRSPNFPTKENGKQITLHNHTGLLTLLDLDGAIAPKKREGEDKEDFQRREWEWMASKQHWNPIKLVVPTAGEVLADPLEAEPPVILWRHRIEAYNLNDLLLKNSEKYRKGRGVLGAFRDAWATLFDMKGDPYEPIDVIEWWSTRWHGMKRLGGGALFWEPNTTGIQPYIQVWGGNAISPTRKDFDIKWWVQQATMHKVVDEIVMEAQATSAHHTLLMRAATARLGTSGDALELAEQMKHGILEGEPNSVWIEKVPDLPQQSFAHKAGLQKSIDEYTFSPAVAGLREMATETATGVLTRAENTSRTFKSNIAKMGHLWSLGSSNILKLASYLNREGGDAYKQFGEIGIGEDKLRVMDIGDPPQFHMIASFEQVDMAVQMQKTQEEVALAEKGFSSWEAVQRARRVEDPESLWEEITRDRARNDPEVMEEYVINAFRIEGFNELADKREAALKMRRLQRMMGQPLGAVPGAMQPGAPPTNGGGRMP